MEGRGFDVEVVADAPLPGLAECVDEVGDLDADEAAARLQLLVAEADLPVPVERGGAHALERIVRRLQGRRLVEDLGELPTSFELLALHVPPRGKASLELERRVASERQVSVRALGFGFGGGRVLTIALNEGIPERATCMRILQGVTLRVQRFAAQGEAELVTSDVVRYDIRALHAWPDCPWCTVNGEPDPFDFEADHTNALDLRGYDTEVRRNETYTLEGVRTADVGVSLPGTGGATVGFHLEQRTSITCAVAYTFPPGACFTPYRRRGETAALPCWDVR